MKPKGSDETQGKSYDDGEDDDDDDATTTTTITIAVRTFRSRRMVVTTPLRTASSRAALHCGRTWLSTPAALCGTEGKQRDGESRGLRGHAQRGSDESERVREAKRYLKATSWVGRNGLRAVVEINKQSLLGEREVGL